MNGTLSVSPGRTVILPKRHIGWIFEATKEEVAALWEAVTIIAVSVFAFSITIAMIIRARSG